MSAANDNDIGQTGVERCDRLLEMAAYHPEVAVAIMLAMSIITDLSQQNDQDGFYIAAENAEELLELEPWGEIQVVTDPAGHVIDFQGWTHQSDGLATAIKQAVIDPDPTDRAKSLRALAMCAADEAPGDWGWEIAWFLDNRRLGRLRASEDYDERITGFETEMGKRTWQALKAGSLSDGP